MYNRFARWSRMDVFAKIFQDLAQRGAQGNTVMMDSTFLKGAPRRDQSPEVLVSGGMAAGKLGAWPLPIAAGR